MKKGILQNGTRVVSYAPDNECDNELGTITGSYEYNGKVYYDIRLDGQDGNDLDMNEEGIHFDVVPTEFVNLTPHDIKLNNGTVYPASGKVARVENDFSNFCCGISKVFYGDVENLPEPKRGTMYIVSAMVLAAESSKHRLCRRRDLVAPATGHPDCIRKDGFIVSVPGFVRNQDAP